MQLWGEHLGVLENGFLDPSSLECVRRVNAMAQHNWDVYAGEQVQVWPRAVLHEVQSLGDVVQFETRSQIKIPKAV
jgi:phospholipase D1/2